MRITGLVVAAALSVGCGNASSAADAGSGTPNDGGPLGKTCAELLFCDQQCGSSNSCTNGCFAQTTAVGQGLFDTFNDCLNTACPSADGGACASSSSSACSDCNKSAATGACVSELEGCESDTVSGPPNPDGGAAAPADAGTLLSCGALIQCQAACPVDGGACDLGCLDQGTSEAQALAGALNGCLGMICPSTDGGACSTPGSACNGCIVQAEYSNVCGAPYDACEGDTSNSPDAGVIPTALIDGGVLSPVLTGTNLVGSTMIVQDGYLYFAQEGASNQVARLSLDGGAVSLIGASQPTPVSLAVDAVNAYVWNYGTFAQGASLNNSDGTVVQIPLDGGAQITLGQGVQVYYAAPYLNAIAVNQGNLYWVQGASGNNGNIMHTAVGSSTPTPLYSQLSFPEGLATDGTNLYWVEWGTFDAQGNSNNDGTLTQAPIDGGTPKVLASNLSAPACLAIDSQNIYWTNLGRLGGDGLPALNSGSVMQVAIDGGSVITLASQQSVPVAIAVSGSTVYWTEYGLASPGLVLSAPVGGGTVVPLAAGLRDPYSLALSSDTLYFSFYAATSPTSPSNVVLDSLTPY